MLTLSSAYEVTVVLLLNYFFSTTVIINGKTKSVAVVNSSSVNYFDSIINLSFIS